MEIDIEPKVVSFDMIRSLIRWRQDETIKRVLCDRLRAEVADDLELAAPSTSPSSATEEGELRQMSERHTKGDLPSERLRALGLDLPAVGADSTYVNHRAVDSSIHVAGQLPYQDGQLLGQGILGRDVDLETGRELARHAVLNALAVAVDAVGGLDRVRIVQMLVFVASTPEFGDQSKVADAASELLVDVLGENGRHARTAIGVASLPRNSPVEIQMVCTAVQDRAV